MTVGVDTASSEPMPRSASRGARPLPVRVLHVVSVFGYGGMEVGVAKLTRGLDRGRFRSAICSTTRAHPDRPPLPTDVPLYELGRRPGTDPAFVAQLYRLLRRTRPDILHTHNWGTLCEGLLAARLAGVPAVVHGEHGTMELRPRNRVVQRWAWARANRVLSVSSRLADRMADVIRFPRDRIEVIRNGVDLDRFRMRDRPDARRALGLDPGEVVVGTVGRLHPVKDHLTLLRATARLVGSEAPVTLVIAGDGPLRDDLLREAAALGVLPRVRLLGHRDDVERVLAALDVFVLPSRSEGLCNTIIEAMAAGLPVVATDVGGTPELVEHGATGLLVPAGDPGALARALEALAADASRRAHMGQLGRQRADREFSLTGAVGRYEAMYLDVAARVGVPLEAAAR